MSQVGSCLAFACVLGLSASSFAQSKALIAVTFDEEILRIDPATGAGTLIGRLPTQADAMGISYYDEKLWVLDQIADQLMIFDAATTAFLGTRAVLDNSIASVFSEGDFEISPTGQAYYAESDGRFNVLDLQTGAAVQLPITTPYNIDGLAFSPSGTLYAMQSGGNFYTVNPSTGLHTSLFNSGAVPGQLGGLKFGEDGTLYAAIESYLYQVDRSSGTYTPVGPIGFDNVSGLTLAVVPEPVAGLLAPLLLLALRRRR